MRVHTNTALPRWGITLYRGHISTMHRCIAPAESTLAVVREKRSRLEATHVRVEATETLRSVVKLVFAVFCVVLVTPEQRTGHASIQEMAGITA